MSPALALVPPAVAAPKKPRKRRRARGQGTVSRRGAWWWIRWRENGQRRSAKFPREDLARETLAKILGGISLGRAGFAPETPPNRSTIADLAGDWLDRRQGTHRSAADDRSRFNTHLLPFFGSMRPGDVTSATIREFVEGRLRTKVLRGGEDDERRRTLSSTTVGHCVRTLSTFMSDLVERGLIDANPCRNLPRATRRLFRNAHDPKDTPFIRKKDDIRRIFLALPEPYNVMYAVGALAGLRTAEVIGLSHEDVSIEGRQIHVRQQVQDGELCGLKDSESRHAPILDSLLPILRQWRIRTGGVGLMFKPRVPRRGGRPELGRPARFVRQHTLNARLAAVLAQLGISEPGLAWYEATRHTFASHWTMDGRTLERLQQILGHDDIRTTQRYSHLAPGAFSTADLAAVSVDLSAPAGRVVRLPKGRSLGGGMGSGATGGGGGVG